MLFGQLPEATRSSRRSRAVCTDQASTGSEATRLINAAIVIRLVSHCNRAAGHESDHYERQANVVAGGGASPAYADVSEKIVSRKPLGSLTSNARLFHSVS